MRKNFHKLEEDLHIDFDVGCNLPDNEIHVLLQSFDQKISAKCFYVCAILTNLYNIGSVKLQLCLINLLINFYSLLDDVDDQKISYFRQENSVWDFDVE